MKNDPIKKICLRWFRFGVMSNSNNENEIQAIFESDWEDYKYDQLQIHLINKILELEKKEYKE